MIGRKFHVSYSTSGATRVMHRLGFSPQIPPGGSLSATSRP
ncbi:winged helix-turn-helix domain-containing protein [Streptomyces sp. NPDC002688]